VQGEWRESAFVDYVESKKRVEVRLDAALVERTLALRDAALAAMQSDTPPPPLVGSSKCIRCSLAPLCLPDETNTLAGRDTDEPRRLMPTRDDALPLYVVGQGATVGVSGERLVVRRARDAKPAEELRLIDVSDVSVFGAVSVTTPALRTCVELGIPVSFFSTGGWYYASTFGFHHKNVTLRIAQHAAARDDAQALDLARAWVVGKIRNQRTLLRRNARDAERKALAQLAQWARRAATAAEREVLLGIEGSAARVYFGAFVTMLKGPMAEVPGIFEGRNRRPPKDPVNAMLSFAYAVLVKDVTLALQSVGFDPMLGFLHQVRYGKPALALDLMEEFRPLIADSVVLSCINTQAVTVDDFITGATGCALKERGRKALLEAYARRLDELVTHPVFGYRISYRQVLHVQARLLARYLQGEFATPPTFQTR
jgi:CRISPR-associated protein Cas1